MNYMMQSLNSAVLEKAKVNTHNTTSDNTARPAAWAEQGNPLQGGKPGESKHYPDTQEHELSDEDQKLPHPNLDSSSILTKLLNKGWVSWKGQKIQ